MVKKVDAIDTSKFIKNTDYDNKINNVEGKILSITGLATTSALTAVKNEIITVDDVYNKIKSDNLYITATDYNKFTKDVVDPKIKKVNY